MQSGHSMQVEVFQFGTLNISSAFEKALNKAKTEFDCYAVSAVLKEIKLTGYGEEQFTIIFTVSNEDSE